MRTETRTLYSADQLRDHLNRICEQGESSAAVLIHDNLWLAYPTDPDGEWFFESGDPTDRFEYDDDGQPIYKRVGFDWVGKQITTDRPAEVLWPLGWRLG